MKAWCVYSMQSVYCLLISHSLVYGCFVNDCESTIFQNTKQTSIIQMCGQIFWVPSLQLSTIISMVAMYKNEKPHLSAMGLNKEDKVWCFMRLVHLNCDANSDSYLFSSLLSLFLLGGAIYVRNFNKSKQVTGKKI